MAEVAPTQPCTSAAWLRWVFSVLSGDTGHTTRFAIAILWWSPFMQIATTLWPVCFFLSQLQQRALILPFLCPMHNIIKATKYSNALQAGLQYTQSQLPYSVTSPGIISVQVWFNWHLKQTSRLADTEVQLYWLLKPSCFSCPFRNVWDCLVRVLAASRL